MKFEHLVEINDLSMPQGLQLSREQLWFGLLCRAEDPRPFLPGLERCQILERKPAELHRVLHFGSSAIRDCVRFEAMQWMSFSSAPTTEHAGGELRINIEEPQPGALFLRFCYQTTLGEQVSSADGAEGADEDAQFADFVRAAYHQSDLDTVRVIRQLASSHCAAH